jgi:hypothetical protein
MCQQNKPNSAFMTHLRHGRLQTFAVQKHCSSFAKVWYHRSIAWKRPPGEGHMAIHIRRRELIALLGAGAPGAHASATALFV